MPSDSIQNRLDGADRVIPIRIRIEIAVWEIMKSRQYQNSKCNYGSALNNIIFYSVIVPGLDRRYTNEDIGISRSYTHARQTNEGWE